MLLKKLKGLVDVCLNHDVSSTDIIIFSLMKLSGGNYSIIGIAYAGC